MIVNFQLSTEKWLPTEKISKKDCHFSSSSKSQVKPEIYPCPAKQKWPNQWATLPCTQRFFSLGVPSTGFREVWCACCETIGHSDTVLYNPNFALKMLIYVFAPPFPGALANHTANTINNPIFLKSRVPPHRITKPQHMCSTLGGRGSASTKPLGRDERIRGSWWTLPCCCCQHRTSPNHQTTCPSLRPTGSNPILHFTERLAPTFSTEWFSKIGCSGEVLAKKGRCA